MLQSERGETVRAHAERVVAEGKDCCQTCRFAFPWDGMVNGNKFNHGDAADDFLICRRYAPMAESGYGFSRHLGYWCGDHEPGKLGVKSPE